MKLLNGIVIAVLVLIVFALFFMPPVEQSRQAARRTQCRIHMQRILLAMHEYHSDYGSFPPAVVYGPDEQPMHSWRVLLLPYLEQKELYDRYRLDEPWDSPHNAVLQSEIPATYRCPAHEDTDSNLTTYVVVTDASGVFDGGRATEMSQIKSPATTLVLAEVDRHAVLWLQPTDVTLDNLLTDLRRSVDPDDSHHTGGLHLGFADGHVEFVESDRKLRELGEMMSPD